MTDIRANKPVKHGFDHGRGGQDPIPPDSGFLHFGDNIGEADGGYLHVETNDLDGAGRGLFLDIKSGDATIQTVGAMAFSADSMGLSTLTGDLGIEAAANLSVGGVASATLGSGGPVNITAFTDKTTFLIGEDFYEVRALKNVFGIGSLVYRAILNADLSHWDHVWYDGLAGGTPLMSIIWNGASWDYEIKSGHAWVASL